MRVSWDRAKAGESHLVLAEQLAEVDAWVGIFASLGSVVVLVENVDLVDVLWAPFDGVDVVVTEDACSFPHSSDKCRAHHGFSIVVLTSVFPAVYLRDCHHVGDVKASLRTLGCNARDVQALSTKMLVEGLSKEDVSEVLVDSLDD